MAIVHRVAAAGVDAVTAADALVVVDDGEEEAIAVFHMNRPFGTGLIAQLTVGALRLLTGGDGHFAHADGMRRASL